MPYYNRRQQLVRSLTSIEEVYMGHFERDDIELSVCDDGSDTSQAIGISNWYFESVVSRLEQSPPLNPCLPINVAVEQANNDIIVLTNPEIEHREPVFLEMLELLNEPNDYVVARCWDDELGWLADESVDYTSGGRLPVPAGAHFHFCAMFNRELWERAGGFDEDYRFGQACEDNDWLWRLEGLGANFKLTEGVVYHHRSGVKWDRPHNRELFYSKWPELK